MRNIFTMLAERRAEKFKEHCERSLERGLFLQAQAIELKREKDVLEGNLRARFLSELGDKEDEIADLQTRLRDKDREYNKDFDANDDEAEARIREINQDAEKLIETNRQKAVKEAREAVATEMKALKSDLAEHLSTKGKYEGALEIIKSLRQQITDLTRLNANLLDNLPSVKANITTPEVTVNN